ncbi:MAG: hypothetical protein ABEI32_09480 [Halothece sp.]
MFSQQELDTLRQHEPNWEHPTLSLYLNIDQSQPQNLNRGFVTVAKNQLRSLENQIENDSEQKATLEAFQASAKQVLDLISNYTPHGKSLIVFCSHAQDFFWYRELQVPFRNNAFWGDTPYLYPLLEAQDEFERYGVVLVDKTHARLFSIYMGEIEESQTASTQEDIRHVKTTGRDHLTSQMHFQRQDDTHLRWHLKHVADLTERLTKNYGFDHLILAGAKPVTDELYHLFPKRLRSRVVRSISLPTDASEKEVLEKTLEIEQQVEREHERQLVETLLSTSAEDGRAVTGIDETVKAINEGRVWELLYTEGFTEKGYECPNCYTLFTDKRETCSYCGHELRHIDLLEKATEHTLNLSGKVELVRGTAREHLQQAQGMGAFLRG